MVPASTVAGLSRRSRSTCDRNRLEGAQEVSSSIIETPLFRCTLLLLVTIVCAVVLLRSCYYSRRHLANTVYHAIEGLQGSRDHPDTNSAAAALEVEEAAPRLVFKHLPKAGGTFIRAHLGNMIPDRKLVFVDEFESLARQEADAFILGSIRAPCSYYLSLWSYGSHGKGWQFSTSGRAGQMELYGLSPPFDNRADKGRLTAWLLENAGLLTSRVRQSYGLEHHEISVVHCWIHTEQLERDLRRCLLEYEVRGGGVKWEHFPGGDAERVNSEAHAPCSRMFDSSREALVREMDGRVFSAFNYSSCC
mmetsp:Transcript_23508/g.65184  ORF Transcript_23508/g.65184 Transcript_23508/m.65184 type:complete len:306 (-) Transcript_23508:1461-2378(-)